MTERLIGTKQDAVEMSRALTSQFRELQREYWIRPRNTSYRVIDDMLGILRLEQRLTAEFFVAQR